MGIYLIQRHFQWIWTITALICIAIAAMGTQEAVAMRQSPLKTIVQRGATTRDLRQVIMSYVENEQDADPLIQLSDSVWVKASNYTGIDIAGEIYYYQLTPHASFDPLSRGEVQFSDIRIRATIDAGDFQITIYTFGDPRQI